MLVDPEPLVSVIIPAYGHAEHISTAIDSALNQTLASREIIVINDGSPDHTHEVLQPYIAAGQIRYSRQENQGQSRARNAGLQLARGSYIAFLDDDDFWPCTKLEAQISALQQNPTALFVYGPIEIFRSSPEQREPHRAHSHYPSGAVFKSFLRKNYIVSPGQVVVRADALRDLGGFDFKLWGTDDYDLWLRLARRGSAVFLNSTALYYRIHEKNASRNHFRMYQNIRAVRRKHFGSIPSISLLYTWLESELLLRKQFFNIYLEACQRNLGEKTIPAAKTSLTRAFTIFPLAVLYKSFRSAAAECFKAKA